MGITNEEMEALNRASEILSKYAAQGGLSRADFEHYEKMVIAIIDEHGTKADKYQMEKKQTIRQLVTVLSAVIEQKKKPAQDEEQRQFVKLSLPSTPSFTSFALPIMNGVYSEELKTGGELKIEGKSWSIQYYFPGPDRRYNGTFVTIRGQDLDRYINAWRSNLKKYYELSRTVEKGKQFQMIGDMNMTIGVGGYLEGVYLRSYHMRARTPKEVDEIIKDYEYARIRAEQIISASRR